MNHSLSRPDTSLPPPRGPDDLQPVGGDRTGRRSRIPLVVRATAALALVAGILGGRLSLQSRVDDLTVERNSLSSDNARIGAERDRLTSEIEDLGIERDTLTSEIEDLGIERDGLSHNVVDLTSDAAEDAATIAELSTDLATEQRGVDVLEAKNETLRTAIVSSLEAARLPAFDWLIVDDEFIAELEASGANFALAHELLADLGVNETFPDWIQGDRDWRAYDRTMAQLDDDQLRDAADRYWDAPAGSDEETAAMFEYQWRLHHLIIQPLVASDAAID